MSYPGLPPSSELASWISQQVQQGNMDQRQALLHQFSIPQYPLPHSSRPASYAPSTHGQMPPANFSTCPGSSCPHTPFPTQFPRDYNPVPFPVQSNPPVPHPHAGTSAPAYGGLEDIDRPAPQHDEPVQSYNRRPGDYHMGPQQVLPTRSLVVQQNSSAPPYRDQPVPTSLNVTTIHPTLGLCVLVPVGALGASTLQGPGAWTVASNNAGPGPGPSPSHRDHYYVSRADRPRRRHSRELHPYARYMTPSPSGSFSPYHLSPSSSSVTVTPALLHHHHHRHRRATPDYHGGGSISSSSNSSPRHFRGIGGFLTPSPRRRDAPRPPAEGPASTVGTCSQCGAAAAGSSYEPSTDGSVPPPTTPRIGWEGGAAGRGGSPRGHVGAGEGPAEDRGRFQASVEEVDE